MLDEVKERRGSKEGKNLIHPKLTPHPKTLFLSSLLSLFYQKRVMQGNICHTNKWFQYWTDLIGTDFTVSNIRFICHVQFLPVPPT